MKENLRFSRVLALLIIFALSSTLFTACSDDKDPEPQLEGTWSLNTYNYTGTITTLNNGQTISVANLTTTAPASTAKIIMDSDGTYTTTGSITFERKYTLDGQTSTTNQTRDVAGSGTWSHTEDKITFVTNGDESLYTIVELTASTLIYTRSIEESRLNSDGNTQIAKGDYTYTYSR